MCGAQMMPGLKQGRHCCLCVRVLTPFPLFKVLNVERNQLTYLPRSIGNLIQLQTLNVKGKGQEALSV